MRFFFQLFMHLLVSIAKLIGPGGARGLLAETLLLKHQLLILNRGRKRAPNLTVWDRFALGFVGFFMKPGRAAKSAVVVSTATLFKCHQALVRRKYSKLFSSVSSKRKPGPKGPSRELIDAIVAMKTRNPRFGCPRIAGQINKTFGLHIDKDVVRRVLSHALEALAAGRWSVMADSTWARERQFVERRLVPVRVHLVADPLGVSGDGPEHAAHRRFWHPAWRGRRARPVPNV